MAYPYNPQGFQPKKPKAPPIFGAFSQQASPAPTQPTQRNPYQWNDEGRLGGAADFTRFGEWGPYMIQGNLGGAASHGLDQLYGSLGQYDAFRQQGINALSPGGIQALLSAFRNRQMAGATEQGTQNAAMLRSQGIQGADASAMLDARNRAADATNEYSQNLYDPAQMAQRAQMGMGLSSPQAAAPIFDLIMALQRQVDPRVQQNNAEHAARAGSGLGGILGNVLGMATGGGFGNLGRLFGGGGGGGWSNPNGASDGWQQQVRYTGG